MLRMTQQQAFSELARNKIIHIKSESSDKWAKVRIEQFSWYRAKCIYLGRIVDASNPGFVGQQYIGSVKQVTEDLQSEGGLAHLELTEAEMNYLLQPWDVSNPTTNHEKRANPDWRPSLTS